MTPRPFHDRSTNPSPSFEDEEPVRTHLRDNRRFQQAIKVLKDNTALTRTASERIVEIVQSLKNFA